MASSIPDSLVRWRDFGACKPHALQRRDTQLPAMKRIESWLNTRILELRSKIDQLKRYKPTNRIGGRMREFQLAHYESELDHWLYFLGEDEK